MIPFFLCILGQGIQYWCYFYKGILLIIFNFCKTNKDGHIKKIFQLVFEWWTSAKIIICIFSHKICKNRFFFLFLIPHFCFFLGSVNIILVLFQWIEFIFGHIAKDNFTILVTFTLILKYAQSRLLRLFMVLWVSWIWLWCYFSDFWSECWPYFQTMHIYCYFM